MLATTFITLVLSNRIHVCYIWKARMAATPSLLLKLLWVLSFCIFHVMCCALYDCSRNVKLLYAVVGMHDRTRVQGAPFYHRILRTIQVSIGACNTIIQILLAMMIILIHSSNNDCNDNDNNNNCSINNSSSIYTWSWFHVTTYTSS